MMKTLVALLGMLVLGGCANAHDPTDPFEPFNRSMYNFNNKVDKNVVKPVAQGYVKVVPSVGRIMISNFFSNLDDATVTLNDLLQFKLVQGVSDGMRFVVNSTIGAFGLIDVATPGGLVKHNQDFGQTLGVWGIGSGPYVVIPVLGPSTIRDGVGLYVDDRYDPAKLDAYVPHVDTLIANGVQTRAGLLDGEQILDTAAVDPYAFMRDTYLLHRKSLVSGGKSPKINYDEDN